MSSIDITSGSEGPKHDPYSYYEITVERESGASVKIHFGLTEWIEVNGIRSNCDYKTASEIFEDLADISVATAQKVYERRATTCGKCGGREPADFAAMGIFFLVAGHPAGSRRQMAARCGWAGSPRTAVGAGETGRPVGA